MLNLLFDPHFSDPVQPVRLLDLVRVTVRRQIRSATGLEHRPGRNPPGVSRIRQFSNDFLALERAKGANRWDAFGSNSEAYGAASIGRPAASTGSTMSIRPSAEATRSGRSYTHSAP